MTAVREYLAGRNIPTLHTFRATSILATELQPDDITPDGIVSDVQVMKSGVLVTFSGDVDRWARVDQCVQVLARIVRD